LSSSKKDVIYFQRAFSFSNSFVTSNYHCVITPAIISYSVELSLVLKFSRRQLMDCSYDAKVLNSLWIEEFSGVPDSTAVGSDI
jgi:hypothetical protein